MRLIFIFITLVPYLLFAQSASKETTNSFLGYAPDYVGKKVTFYRTLDYVTNKKEILGTSTVGKSDSTFTFEFSNAQTKKITIKIDNNEADLYVNPGQKYAFKFPKAEPETALLDDPVDLILIGIDSTDINYKIAAFNMWQDQFLNIHFGILMSSEFAVELDTFKMYVQDYYKDEKDIYFLNYVKFSLAELELISPVKNEAMRRLMAYFNYIRKQPMLFGHDKYIGFLANFYSNQFKRYGPQIELEIDNAIREANRTALDTCLKKDKMLENSIIREFVTIVNLGKVFYDFEYNPNNILAILDSIRLEPKLDLNGKIAANIIDIIKSRTAGFPAPRFTISDGNTHFNSGQFRGKYLYIQFFTTWDERAQKELLIMRNMFDKYHNEVEFLSIALDEDKEGYRNFMAKEKFPWKHIHIDNEHQMVQDYEVENTPTYFLIDPEGFLVQSPALSPSPNGEYETIDKTFYYIHERANPKEGGRSY